SLHLDQIDDLDDFLEKIRWFNQAKREGTNLYVTSIVTDHNLDILRSIENRLNEMLVKFEYKRLKYKSDDNVDSFHEYAPEVDRFISSTIPKGKVEPRKFTSQGSYGTYCYTGYLFLKVNLKGDVYRCMADQKGGYLGNIREKTFKRNSDATPCRSQYCICSVPYNRNMILFEKVEEASCS
ncbi:MAG: hypothetical protein PQJ60_02515, partial [Spirochaetales bacterium]|nr:hypothetical protein [Spirochaetales bacterium]